MRTTLTLDDDVAAQLEQLRRASDVPLKRMVNDALRQGLRQMADASKTRRKPYRTRGLDLGPAKIPLDNVAEALALAEGDDFR
ncbi:MAG TPA: CopG family transcriptional regulator [Caulobacteraceae bacterium]